MKTRKLLRLLGVLLISTVPVLFPTNAGALDTNTVRLAIGPFFAPVGNAALEKAAADLPDLLMVSLSHENRFQLVEREKINAIWSELHLAEAGLTSADTVGKLGRILSCDWLVSGSFVQTGSGTQVWVKVIDTQSGIVLDLQSVRCHPTNFSATVSNVAAFLARSSPRSSARQFIALGRFADLSISSTREDWSQRLSALIEKDFLAAGYGVVEREAVAPIFSEFQLQTAGLTGDSTNRVKLKPAFWVVDGGCKWIYDTQDKLSVALRVQKMGGGEQIIRLTEPPGEELEKAVVAAIQSVLTNTAPVTLEQAQMAEANLRSTRAQEPLRDEPWIPSRFTTNKTVFTFRSLDQNGKTIVFTNADQDQPVFGETWARNVGRDRRDALEQAILLNTNDMRSKFMLGRGMFLSSDPMEKKHGRDMLEEVAASNDATNAAKARTWLTSVDQTGHPPGWHPTVVRTNQPEPDWGIANAATTESAMRIPTPGWAMFHLDQVTAVNGGPDGFLVATGNSLRRWGSATTGMEEMELPLKLEHPIIAIESDDNDLWLGTDGGGLIRIPKSGGTPRVFGEKDGFPMPSIRSLRLVSGRLFIGFGFRESGAFGYLDTKTEKFTGSMSEVNLFKPGKETSNSAPERSIFAIKTADEKNLWVASDTAIYHLELASQQWNLSLPLGSSSSWLKGAHNLSVNSNFVAAIIPLKCVTVCKQPGNQWEPVNLSKDPNENVAFSICADHYNPQLLWIGGNSRITLFDVATMKTIGVCHLPSYDHDVRWIFCGRDTVTFFVRSHSSSGFSMYQLERPAPFGTNRKTAEQTAEDRRLEFLRKNFEKFVPVQFQKDGNGKAAVQRLPVRDNMFEYEGMYYCGFKFTIPEWLDGDFEWIYLLAKTEAEKDFNAQKISRGMISDNDDQKTWPETIDSPANNPQLKQQFPYTSRLDIQLSDQNLLQAGKTYGIWFGFHEKNMPDIAFAMTITSKRGSDEFGALPLR